MTTTTEAIVSATKVQDGARLMALPNHFGKYGVRVESAVFSTLNGLCADYNGGYWEYYGLSNGGFYMAPVSNRPFQLQCAGNDFNGAVSADAAGIIAFLFAYSHLSFQLKNDKIVDAFHHLRDFAYTHKERRLIFAAID